MSLLLEGKRAFITGGTRGIGAALCQVFAREGAEVAFNYGSRDDLAEEVMGIVQALGRRARSFKVSVTDRFGMKHLTRELVQEWGGIDILVNNAAPIPRVPPVINARFPSSNRLILTVSQREILPLTFSTN